MISLSLSDIAIEKLKSIFGDKREGALVTAALKYAFENNLPIINVPFEYKESSGYRPFHVSKAFEIKLKKALKERISMEPKASLASVALGLISSSIAAARSNQEETLEKAEYITWLESAGLSTRPEQNKMIKSIDAALNEKSNAIVFCEASVGVGKSYAKAVTAIKRAQALTANEEAGCVVIAAPTYQIAHQIADALSTIITSNNIDLDYAITRSRAEYISEKNAQSLLSNDGEFAPSKEDKTIIQKLVEANNFERDVWEQAGVNCSNLTLSSRNVEQDDLGEIQYQEQRDSYRGEKIVVCTHALLACHSFSLRRRAAKILPENDYANYVSFNEACIEIIKDHPNLIDENRMLPPIDLLIVDEAHALHDSYQSLKEKRLSINTLRKQIKAALPKTTTSEMAFVDEFVAEASLKQDARGLFPAKLTSTLVEGCQPLSQKLKAKRRSPEKQALTESIDELRDITS